MRSISPFLPQPLWIAAIGVIVVVLLFYPSSLSESASYKSANLNSAPTSTASGLQLLLDESGPAPDQVTALDAVLLVRDPFLVVNSGNSLTQGSDRNTRVMIFVANLQLAQGEPASSVVVNLVDSNSQTYDIAAEDVRMVPDSSFTQVIFRLPDSLASGMCTVKVKAHDEVSNSGVIAIGPTSVAWSQSQLTHSIGSGDGASDTVQITFISNTYIRNASLSVDSAIAPFVKLDPSTIPLVEPAHEYSVTVRFVVPQGASPGSYIGNINLASTQKILQPLNINLNVDFGGNVVSSSTRVLSDSSLSKLSDISADGSTLTFSGAPPELGSMAKGNIIVSGPSDMTPTGLLRKVDDVTIINGQTIVHTSQASLEDAIQDASISLSASLSSNQVIAGTSLSGAKLRRGFSAQSETGFFVELNDVVLYDDDNNQATTHDQIKVDGAIALQPS